MDGVNLQKLDMDNSGVAAFFVGFLVSDDPSVIEPVTVSEDLELPECCYELPLLVEAGNPADQDPFKNDKTSYFQFYDSGVDAAALTLVKCIDGVEVDQVIISDNTYGEFLDFGVEQHDDRKYISIKNINWTLIFDDFGGAGEFRFRADHNSIFASIVPVPRFDFSYHLKEFNDERARITVFLRIFNSGNLVDQSNASKGKTKFTFPDAWVDGIRFDGKIGGETGGMTRNSTVFRNGFEEYTELLLPPRYVLSTDFFYQKLRDFINIIVRAADLVEITNYGNNLPSRYEDWPVQADGPYEPDYFEDFSLAIFKLEFKHAHQGNYEANHC